MMLLGITPRPFSSIQIVRNIIATVQRSIIETTITMA